MTAAFKFLRPGRVGAFTGVQWPAPGSWLESHQPPSLCRSGIHALTAGVLPIWMAEELWRVELDDARAEQDGIVIARRGRLLEQVTGWNDQLAREYGEACIAHVSKDGSPVARERLADAVAELPGIRAGGAAASVGYIAAKAVDADRPGGYEAERRWQAAWLSERLGLSA